MKSKYHQQVDLLLEVLPLINKHHCFALKGGTAINLFLHNMPRLSVDIDLCYLPIEPRDVFLKNISNALLRLSKEIEEITGAQVKEQRTAKDKQLTKLLISKNDAQIKIEPNLVLRGSVFEVETKTLCNKAQEVFLRSFKVKTLSEADIYAGKICAALDRQHPRDLFDIKILLEHQGITDEIRKAFIVYLACGPRPMHELLQPNLIDMQQPFENEFSGMTSIPVTYDELLIARKTLIHTIQTELTAAEREFLLSIKQTEPKWSLLNIPRIENLPALKWKLLNIQNMDKAKHQKALEKLKKVLG